jgi:hypothetical protein
MRATKFPVLPTQQQGKKYSCTVPALPDHIPLLQSPPWESIHIGTFYQKLKQCGYIFKAAVPYTADTVRDMKYDWVNIYFKILRWSFVDSIWYTYIKHWYCVYLCVYIQFVDDTKPLLVDDQRLAYNRIVYTRTNIHNTSAFLWRYATAWRTGTFINGDLLVAWWGLGSTTVVYRKFWS